MKNTTDNLRAVGSSRLVLLFREGIAFRFWHHYGKPHGTAVRLLRCKPGLFGVRLWDGGLYLGAWWTIRLELVCIHITRFQQNGMGRRTQNSADTTDHL